MNYFGRQKTCLCLLVYILLLVLGCSKVARSTEAADPVSVGPFEVTSGEYRLPPRKDAIVDAEVVTELWARIYRPKYMYIKPYPIIVLLHGNHGTCGRIVQGIPGRFDDSVQYTTSGTCPTGYKVVRSHEGFAYVAGQLASWGYVVVSVNANRGINGANGDTEDLYLNMRRGRLVLRHLMLIEQWNRLGGAPASVGFDVKGSLDFTHVGLMGHSRGGEGVLAAYSLFKELGSPWPARFANKPKFRGIFAIAPVTNQTMQRLYADDVPWAALLPLCDGDVYTMDALQVFNRTIRDRFETSPGMKAVLGVWGANHNFYNTEWHQSDAARCIGTGNTAMFNMQKTGSAAQRKTAVFAALGFFRAHLGHEADKSFASLFNPSFSVPQRMAEITRYERVYSESASPSYIRIVDDFAMPTGLSLRLVKNKWRNVNSRHRTIVDHQNTLRVNAVSWSRKAGQSAKDHYFQSNGWPLGKGHPLAPFQNLEFRLALACQETLPIVYVSTPKKSDRSEPGAICNRPFPVNAEGNISFSVALVHADGRLSRSVQSANYTRTNNPVGGKSTFFSLFPPIEDFSVLAIHPLLQTVHIPLKDFAVAEATPVRGVRFTFDQSKQGSIYIANVRFSKPVQTQSTPLTSRRPVTPRRSLAMSRPSTSRAIAPAEVTRMAKTAARPGGHITGIKVPSRNFVEISLTSHNPIPVRNSLLMLRIGNRQFMLSRFGANGNTSQVIFSLTPEEYQALPQGANVELINGPQRLSFGTLDKS